MDVVRVEISIMACMGRYFVVMTSWSADRNAARQETYNKAQKGPTHRWRVSDKGGTESLKELLGEIFRPLI